MPTPAFRRLRGYAFDPSLSTWMDTALVNEVVFKVPWESSRRPAAPLRSGAPDEPADVIDSGLGPGPVGEYLEVIDYDPASQCFYEPVDLDSPLVLAQDGLEPTEGNPQFHQQMVYAVAMTTINNFERALGRFAMWGTRPDDRSEFIQRLRIYPHALREANAYYSPSKKALLFGYFPARADGSHADMPGGMVFTCLSHDIIAHEISHALLDGVHRRWTESTNPDALAFHEAFADIVALFQHFSFPDVLVHQIAKTRGNLATNNALGQLARQFGHAIGHRGALRDAIGVVEDGEWRPQRPDPRDYATVLDPHGRGAILVGAVFDAFTAIYDRRVADLIRIASGGSGILREGALHPDLVNRMAHEAAKAAQHVLEICIRALDYCPPVDVTFGDYLRALITADSDLVPEDERGYRLAFIEAFRRRGIYPEGIRTLSVDSLRWPDASRRGRPQWVVELATFIRNKLHTLLETARTRRAYFDNSRKLGSALHGAIRTHFSEYLEFLSSSALRLTGEALKFEIHQVHPVQRVGRDGMALNQVIVTITQKREVPLDPDDPDSSSFEFRGGSTLIFDLDTLRLVYAISKGIDDEARLERQRRWRCRGAELGRGTYSQRLPGDDEVEPFALLHRYGSEASR
ncbi:MAG: hypothetical protein AB1Z98_31640 [Nannocystaceae bacterium]